jgi:hypothetical protein
MTTDTSLGKDCKTYYNTGTHASPSWVLIGRISDETVTPGKSEIAVSGRDSPFDKTQGGQLTLDASFTYRAKKGTDAIHAMLLDSLLNSTAVQFAFMDGIIATSGNRGWRAFFEVFSMAESRGLGDAVAYSIDLKHTDHQEGGDTVNADNYEVS